MDYPFDKLPPGFYGLMAPAGSGKTTFSNTLPYKVIHVDDYMIGDSLYRKSLLREKQAVDFEMYEDACNQLNWWDWSRLFHDLSFTPTTPVIVEGAILGPKFIRAKLDKIFFFSESPETRFSRVMKRDSSKRVLSEILARFLVCEQSENRYYRNIWANDQETRVKTVFINKYKEVSKPYFLPIEVC